MVKFGVYYQKMFVSHIKNNLNSKVHSIMNDAQLMLHRAHKHKSKNGKKAKSTENPRQHNILQHRIALYPVNELQIIKFCTKKC